MKLFLRGLLAFGVSAVLAATVAAETPAPPVAPTNAAPATAGSVVAGADCGCNGVGSAHKLLRGRFGKRGGIGGSGVVGGGIGGFSASGARLDAMGGRMDNLAEAYIGANQRVMGFLTRLAGPPVDVAAGPAFGGKQKGGPYTQPGTVVFPQHPFVRSPRDFFMTEQP